MTPHTFKRKKPLLLRREGESVYVTAQGRTFIMDAEDLHVLDGWTIIISRGYVHLQGPRRLKPIPRPSLARVLVCAPKGMEVDHISGDRLDNRKANLRICTHTENSYNLTMRGRRALFYKGCCFVKNRKSTKKWIAQIHIGRINHYLGGFLTAEEAAAAYNAKAIEAFGRFARINVIGSPGQTISAAVL